MRAKAGTPLKLLHQLLEGEGLAMKNIGSISEQTVAGAISTGQCIGQSSHFTRHLFIKIFN